MFLTWRVRNLRGPKHETLEAAIAHATAQLQRPQTSGGFRYGQAPSLPAETVYVVEVKEVVRLEPPPVVVSKPTDADFAHIDQPVRIVAVDIETTE